MANQIERRDQRIASDWSRESSSLEESRKRNKLFLYFYKIRNGQTGINNIKFLTPLGLASRPTDK